jgi:hypothetical protein
MITRPFLRLIFAVLLAGISSTAWATGQYIQEIRFFSRSGVDPDNNIPYFHGRLGILPRHSTTTACLPPIDR